MILLEPAKHDLHNSLEDQAADHLINGVFGNYNPKALRLIRRRIQIARLAIVCGKPSGAYRERSPAFPFLWRQEFAWHTVYAGRSPKDLRCPLLWLEFRAESKRLPQRRETRFYQVRLYRCSVAVLSIGYRPNGPCSRVSRQKTNHRNLSFFPIRHPPFTNLGINRAPHSVSLYFRLHGSHEET
jgi:hypothetical protein